MTFRLPLGRLLPSRMAMPLAFGTAFFLLSQVLRASLALLFPPAAQAPVGDWVRVFVVGLHLDLTVACWVAFPWAVIAGWPGAKLWARRGYHVGWAIVTAIVWFVMIFNLVAEGFFFEEYQSRYNTVAIDYLIYPHEVFVNVWEAYPVPAVVAVVMAAAVGVTWFGWRVMRQEEAVRGSGPARGVVGMWLLLAVVLRMAVSVDETRFSRERSLNELSNNTFLALASAALTRNLDYAQFYPTLPKEEAWARVRRLLSRGPQGGAFVDPESLIRQVPGNPAAPRVNVVLLLEESLGSEFWGSLGRSGPSLMPRMDAIATNEAVLFDNLYADGNRTIRGYEGVFCSFPPLPGDSIVARDRTDNVETIARVMSRDGYDTTFVYAGRGLFDGTGAFAKANGWSNFVELKDFKAPTFTTVWGVCNEDLYDRVLEECRDRHGRGLPFLVTSMSVSNHKPYTYPPGRIAEDPLERKRDNAVKYSDFALGRFFEMAKKEPFWTNTIFAVIADHGARVYGSQTIPIRSYEIPMVLVGPAVGPVPRRVSTLGCQLDIAPTLLGMIGRPYQSLFFGRDLLRNPDTAARCLLHHNRSVGIYDRQRLVVFSLNRKVEYFEGDPKAGQMTRATTPDAVHQELEKDAIAMFQVADELYMTRRFRMPVRAAESGR